MKKRLLSILCVLALCLTMLPATVLAASPVYMALGDSISTGYAPPLEDGTPQKVASPFANQVAGNYYTLTNLAEDGETSTSLLEKLTSGTIDVTGADLITITIGGNDLMNALYEYLVAKYNEAQSEGANQIDVDDLKAALAEPSILNMGILLSAFQNIAGFPESKQYTDALNTVETNLESIFAELRGQSTSATILVATQYDPYQHLTTSEDDNFKQQIDALKAVFSTGVSELNEKIEAAAAAADSVTVVDVYTQFAGSASVLTNASYEAGELLPTFNLDFHPNQDGHNLIAQTISDVIPSIPVEYDIWVGGIQVTSDNASDVLGDGTVRYDAGTKTLTLNNAEIHAANALWYDNYGIYCNSGDLMTIELQGANTIQCTDSQNDIASFGIYHDVPNSVLTIRGADTDSSASCAFLGIDNGIQTQGSCTIQNAVLEGQAPDPDFALIDYVNGELKISDSTLQVEGANDVFSANSATLERSTILLTGQFSNSMADSSIWSSGALALIDTEIHMESLLTSTGAIKSQYGDVTLAGIISITIRNTLWDSMWYAVYAGGELAVEDGAEVTVSTNLQYGLYAAGALTIGMANADVSSAETALYSGDSVSIGETDDYPKDSLLNASSITITNGQVYAPENYDIWVSGTRVTSDNASDVLGDKTVRYDAATDTLTMSGANIAGAYRDSGIYAGSSLNLELVGENTVTSPGTYGLQIQGALNVSGGSLTVESSGSGEFDGIYANGDLTITNSTVTASGRGEYGSGIYAARDIIIDKNSTVTTTSEVAGNTANVWGSIYVDGTCYELDDDATQLSVVKGVVTGAHIVGTDALYVNGVNMLQSGAIAPEGVSYEPDTNTLTLDSASITAAYTASDSSSYGIYSEGPLIINLVGNTVAKSAADPFECGIYLEGSLIVTGSGSLTVQGEKYGIETDTALTVQSGSINSTATGMYGFGVSVDNGDLMADGGSITGTGTGEFGYGIDAPNGSVTAAGGSVTGKGSVGIRTYAMKVSSGSAVTGESNGELSYGVYVTDGDLMVDGGSVSGTNAGERGHGVYVANGDLTVDGGSVSGTSAGAYGSGVYVANGALTVAGGSVSGTATGLYGSGVYVYQGSLTVTGGNVSGQGAMAAICVEKDGSEGEMAIVLPADYLPAGYELQTAVEELYTSIVPVGVKLDVTEGVLTGAAKMITLKAGQSTQPGGSTGGGGGSDSGSSSTTTDVTHNPDGSTTTTVTNSDGSTTETTKNPDGSQKVVNTDKGGTVTTTTTDQDGNKTETVEKPDGSSQTTITNQDGSGSTTTASQDGQVEAQVKVPGTVVDSAAEKGEAVKLPMPAVPNTSNKETAPTVTADLPAGQSTKVEIPVENPTSGTVAILVKENGSEEVIKTSITNETGVVVTLQDGDKVKIVDNSTDFADVSDNYWGAEAIDFVSSHELMSGIGNGLFDPDTALTRGQLCQILYSLENAPAGGSNVFDDVADGAWYADAVNWAASQGIVYGYGDGSFGPEDNINREQMVAILYHYAQLKGLDISIGEDTNILSYTDALDMSGYAIPAMKWACGAGIISGVSSSSIAPQGSATRAQAAIMLMRFCEIAGK